jgi:hypothetical protein
VTSRLEELVRRKEFLIERCAQEREELAASCQRVRVPLGLGAVLMVVGKRLKSYPILVAGVSSLLVSGYGVKLAKSTGSLFRLGQAILPLWSWLTKRRKRR